MLKQMNLGGSKPPARHRLSLEGMPWIYTDTSPDIVAFPSAEFDLLYEEAWLDDPWSRQVISDIQRIDVTDETRSVRSILAEYSIPPEELATGTKNLLLTKFNPDGRKIRMSMMGENCYKWLMQIADEQDVCGVATKPLFFTAEDIGDREIYFVNTNFVGKGFKGFEEGMLSFIAVEVWYYETGL